MTGSSLQNCDWKGFCGHRRQFEFTPVPLPSRFTTFKVPSFIANDETVLNAQMTFLLRLTEERLKHIKQDNSVTKLFVIKEPLLTYELKSMIIQQLSFSRCFLYIFISCLVWIVVSCLVCILVVV